MRASLVTRTSYNQGRKKDGKLKSFQEDVQYLLKTYAPHDTISEAELDLTKFMKPENISEMEYSPALRLKALRCGTVLGKSSQKSILV